MRVSTLCGQAQGYDDNEGKERTVSRSLLLFVGGSEDNVDGLQGTSLGLRVEEVDDG